MKRTLVLLSVIILVGAGLAFTATDNQPVKNTTASPTAATGAATASEPPVHPPCSKVKGPGCAGRATAHTCCSKGGAATPKAAGCCSKGHHHARKGCTGTTGPNCARTSSGCAGSASRDSRCGSRCRHGRAPAKPAPSTKDGGTAKAR